MKGFTLAEILVVMAITAIVGTILVVIFTNTLRGSNKAQILAVIKQNGQAVLEQMDKTIRNAQNLVCTTPLPDDKTVVVERDGIYSRYRIVLYTARTNGYIVQDHPTRQIDSNSGQLETDIIFRQTVCSSTDLMPRAGSSDTANILTDINLQTGVKIQSGSFSVNPSDGYKPAVTVNFVLAPGINAPTIIVSQIDPVTFQTTIGLR